jgi:hypothetical protein
MKSISLFLLILSLFFGYAQAQTSLIESEKEPAFIYKRDFKLILDSTQDPATDLYYPKLLKRFKLNDSTLTKREVLSLLIGHTISAKYKPLEDLEKEKAIFDLNLEGKYQEALNKGIPFLKLRVLNLLVLREVSYAYGQQAKYYQKEAQYERAIQCQDSAKFYMDLNDKIMEAMIYSGKGKTPSDPIFSLGLEDGDYFVFNTGYELEKKATETNKDGLSLLKIIAADRLTAKPFYFVIQHAINTFDEDDAEKQVAKKSKKTEKKKPEGVVRDSFQIKTYVTQDASGNLITRYDTIQIIDTSQLAFNKSTKSKKKTIPSNDSLQIRTFVTFDEEGFPTTKIDTVRIPQVEVNDVYGATKGKKKKGKKELLPQSDSLSVRSDSTIISNTPIDSATMAKDNWIESKSKKSKKKSDKREKKTDRVEEGEPIKNQSDSAVAPVQNNVDSMVRTQESWDETKSKKSKKKSDKREKKTDRVEEGEPIKNQSDSAVAPVQNNVDSTIRTQESWDETKSKKSKKKSDKREKKTDRGEEGEKTINQSESVVAPTIIDQGSVGIGRVDSLDTQFQSSEKSQKQTERSSKKREKEKSKNKKSDSKPNLTNTSDSSSIQQPFVSPNDSEIIPERKQDSVVNPVVPQETSPASQVPVQPNGQTVDQPSTEANKPQ